MSERAAMKSLLEPTIRAAEAGYTIMLAGLSGAAAAAAQSVGVMDRLPVEYLMEGFASGLFGAFGFALLRPQRSATSTIAAAVIASFWASIAAALAVRYMLGAKAPVAAMFGPDLLALGFGALCGAFGMPIYSIGLKTFARLEEAFPDTIEEIVSRLGKAFGAKKDDPK